MAQLIKNTRTGQYGEMLPDGSVRVINNAKELSEMGLINLRQEQGGTIAERLTIKNFARNPAMGAEFLRSRGYQVLQYGSGLNYAVRRDPSQPWKIVDPQKGGFGEFMLDFADLATDILAAPIIAAGTAAGGGVASAATGAATAAGFELARQGIGAALGIEENFDPFSFETGVQAVGGGVAPGVGALVGKGAAAVTRTAGRVLAGTSKFGGDVAQVIAAKVGGIRPRATLGTNQALLERAAIRGANGKLTPLTHPEDAVSMARGVLDAVASPHPSSTMSKVSAARNAFVEAGENAGKTADLGAMKQEIMAIGDIGILSPRSLDFSPEASALRNQIRALINPPTLGQFKNAITDEAAAQKAFNSAFAQWEKSFSKVNLRAAVEVKDLLQNWVSAQKGFIAVSEAGPRAGAVTKKFVSEAAQLSGRINGAIKARLPKGYAALNEELGRKTEAIIFAREHFGVGKEGAENFVSGLLKGTQGDQVRAVKAFDREFGTDLFKVFRESNLGLQFTPAAVPRGRFGVPKLAPNIGATGQLLTIGIPVSVGAGSGFIAGGGSPEGALIGGAAGLALASPRSMVAIAPHLNRLGQGIEGLAVSAAKAKMPGLIGSHATRVAIIGSIQAAARSAETSGAKQTARTDGTRRGRLNLSGQ